MVQVVYHLKTLSVMIRMTLKNLKNNSSVPITISNLKQKALTKKV